MILKNINAADELMVFVEVHDSDNVPKSLLHEVNVFTLRNPVVEVASDVKSKSPVYACCSRCLKGHLIRKAREEGFGKDVERAVCKMLKCEIGHDGWFMDGEDLVRV